MTDPTLKLDNDVSSSFDEVYRALADRTLNLLYRFTNNEEVARDLLQDVFLKVFQQLGSFEQRSEIATWIHRIAINHALNYLKRERRTVWFNVLDESVGSLLQRDRIDLPDTGSTLPIQPDHMLEDRERQERVAQAVQTLPLKLRLPYLLYRDGELGHAEIAQELGISVSAVETRIHRAKKRLIATLRPLLSGPDG